MLIYSIPPRNVVFVRVRNDGLWMLMIRINLGLPCRYPTPIELTLMMRTNSCFLRERGEVGVCKVQ